MHGPRNREVKALRKDEAAEAGASRTGRYGPISSALLAKLERITPSRDGTTSYFPCLVRLRDGTVRERVYVMPAAEYLKKWGVFPEDDRAKRSVAIGDVADLQESPHRLPPDFANELYAHGESGMGYHTFRVRFRNGASRSYVTGDAVDFIPFPTGMTGADVVKVEPHGGRGDTATSGSQYAWCLYEGIQTAL